MIYKDICKFIWARSVNETNSNDEVRNEIKFALINLTEVIDVYKKICNLIDDEFWPQNIPKI